MKFGRWVVDRHRFGPFRLEELRPPISWRTRIEVAAATTILALLVSLAWPIWHR